MKQAAQIKFRAHEWINTKTLQPIYSIQARVGKNGWAHLHDGGEPMFYAKATERDAALKMLATDTRPSGPLPQSPKDQDAT